MSNLITLTLSRRNLTSLLTKLDRVRDGGASMCTIVKHDTPGMVNGDVISISVMVKGAEDAVVYKDRIPGLMIEDIDDIINEIVKHE